MNIRILSPTNAATAIAALAVLSTLAFSPSYSIAQMPMGTPPQPTQSQPPTKAATQTQDTQAQINQLRQQVAQLQTALQQSKGKGTGSSKKAVNAAKPPMAEGEDSGEMGATTPGAEKPPMGPMKGKMGGMGGMDKMAPPAGAMKSDSAAPVAAKGCCGRSMGMPMAKAGMADGKMGSMPSDAAATMKAKPMAESQGAEAPHLLHIGAKDFFLDHQQHLSITSDQKAQLETIKSDASKQKSTSQGKIDQAEQQLWQLTSADQPNSADIDTKVQEVAQLRAAEQVAFIHSVAMASDVLTREQRAEAVKPMPSVKGSKVQMPKQPMTME